MANILKKILSFVLSPKLLFIYIILVLIIIVKVFLSYELKRPSTSDAQVDGEVILIASQISGQIAKLNVKNNQYVKKGDILFILEPRDHELQVKISENNLELEKINFEEKSVTLKSLEEKLIKKEDAYKRAKTKLKDNKLQNSSTWLKVERLQESFLKARSDYTQQRAHLESKLIIAQKKLDEALIQLSKTEIKAPADGYVTNLRLYQGSYVRAYEDLFGLVNINNLWITANYLEYELINIKKGDSAKLTLSMYPDLEFFGEVDSIGFGIRPENYQTKKPFPDVSPTINWIRLAKRFPVKILIKPTPHSENYPLRIGANAFVTVYSDKSDKRTH